MTFQQGKNPAQNIFWRLVVSGLETKMGMHGADLEFNIPPN